MSDLSRADVGPARGARRRAALRGGDAAGDRLGGHGRGVPAVGHADYGLVGIPGGDLERLRRYPPQGRAAGAVDPLVGEFHVNSICLHEIPVHSLAYM